MPASLKNASILVTGSAGLVGSNLIPRLLQDVGSIRAAYHNKKPAKTYPGVEYVSADLTQKQECMRLAENMDFVVHCAAHKFGAGSTASSPIARLNDNIIMNVQMLEAAYFAGVKHFIWTGSVTAYPPGGDLPLFEEQMFTAEPFEKYFTVSWLLRFTEKLCRAYAEKYPRSMSTSVLRLSNVYGPYDDFEIASSNVIPALIRKTVERWNPLEVWGTGDDIRDFIYVDDVVDAVMLALRQENPHTVVNIAAGAGVSVRQLLSLILLIDDYKSAPLVFNPARPSMIPVRLVDTQKAAELWGFRAKTSLADGLKQTISWYRQTLV